jgi:hypothetical protein
MVFEEMQGEEFHVVLRCGKEARSLRDILNQISNRADSEAIFALKLCELLSHYPYRGHVCEIVAQANLQHQAVTIWFCKDPHDGDEPIIVFSFEEIRCRDIQDIYQEIHAIYGA